MTGRVLEQSQLTRHQCDDMFTLLDSHFEGVTRQQFEADLGEKNWIVLVDDGGTLVGFSTLLVYRTNVLGEDLTVVCSGDTIVSPHAWGSMAFPKTWIESVYGIRDTYGDGRLVWLLLTSGFRTYRLLPVFWQTFYPRVGAATPESWQQMLTTLAAERFGTRFSTTDGMVRFPHPQRLRSELAIIPEQRQVDPHVQFFLQRNPGHARGDELVCIADLSPENLTPAGRRVVYGASGCRAKR